MTYLMLNPPKDITLQREKTHERDLAVWALLGGVRAIVDGAMNRCLDAEWRLGQLARLLTTTEERLVAADAKYEAAIAEWRAEVLAEDSIPV